MSNVTDRSDLLTLSQAARRLPGRPHRSTLWRWARRGIETPSGERIHLRTLRLGRRILIAPEDLQRFAEALGEAQQQKVQPKRHPRPQQHQRQRSSCAEQAEREADELGL